MPGENASPKVNLFEDFSGRLDVGGTPGSQEPRSGRPARRRLIGLVVGGGASYD
jgi:hypothetical protein